MARVVQKKVKETGEIFLDKNGQPKMITLYDPKEKFDYHTKRAKNGSSYIDRNGKERYYTDVQRAKSRGFLNALTMQSKIFSKSNPDYVRVKDRKK